MKTETTSPQSARHSEVRDSRERLYHLIQKRVKWSTFSRLLINPDEVVSDTFMLLVESTLPDFETEEFRVVLRKAVKRVLWNHKRTPRPTLDIDELDEDEHPFYEVDFFSEEREFELVFEQFCESFPEPKRTVFAKSRVLQKKDIAELTGLGRNTVAQMIKAIPGEFKGFFGNLKTR